MRIPTRPLTLLAITALALPATASASATPAGAVTHTVRRGETLTSIAAQDGLSVAQLAAANGLSPSAELVAGTALVIPAQGATAEPATAATPIETSVPTESSAAAETAGTTETETASGGGFVVPRGDTLSGIAAQFGTTPEALAAANGLSVNGLLLAGASLTIPGAESGSAAPAPAAPEPSSVAAAPVSQFVSPQDVGEIAEQDGVPAALAEAVADQESGFNDGEVSATGATGVMQIEPGTWQDLSRIDGLALDPSSATDNVRGGVAVLRSLLDATGFDQSEAVAAYYQGLESVRAHGMFPDTRRYVADVLALESRFGG